MNDDEFKSFQGREAVVAFVPELGSGQHRLDAATVNDLYGDSEDGMMSENMGIPNSDWERQVRALDDEGVITFVSPA